MWYKGVGSKLPKKVPGRGLGITAPCVLCTSWCVRQLKYMWAEGSHVLCLLSVGPAWRVGLSVSLCPLGLVPTWKFLGTVIVLSGGRLVTSTRALPCSSS